MAKIQSSNDYIVYMPESGDPVAGVSPLKCGDIDSVDDNLGGTIQSNIAQSFDLNKPIELTRSRQYSPSQIDIKIPEELSQDIKRMRDLDCMIGMQRRFYCNGDFDHAHHYGYVSFNSIGLRNGVSRGLFGDSGIPTSTFPAIFGLYQYYDKTGPAIHIEEGWNPKQVSYCSEPSCSPCCYNVGCDTAYVLYSNENDETKIDRLVINGSVVSSEQFPYSLIDYTETALLCHNGRLFIGFDAENNVGVMDNQDDINDSPTTPRGNLIFGSVGTSGSVVVKFTASGNVVYALWQDGSTVGIDRSIATGIDDSIAWDTIYSQSGSNGIDISAIGSSVASIIDGAIITNYENGVGKFNLITPSFSPISLSLFLSNFSLPNCPSLFVLSNDTSLYTYKINGEFEQVFSDTNFCIESSRATIRNSEDGYGVWISRAMQRNGKSYALKNMGKGSDCEWVSFANEHFFTFDCGDEVGITLCEDTINPLLGRVILTLATGVRAGSVVVCFQDGTTLPGYLYPENNGKQELAIQTTEPVNCFMRSGIRSLNCEFSSSYPCKSWHEQAFDICPTDPNKSILVLGASCPTGDVSGMILIKDVDADGQVEEIVSLKGEECLPSNC